MTLSEYRFLSARRSGSGSWGGGSLAGVECKGGFYVIPVEISTFIPKPASATLVPVGDARGEVPVLTLYPNES